MALGLRDDEGSCGLGARLLGKERVWKERRSNPSIIWDMGRVAIWYDAGEGWEDSRHVILGGRRVVEIGWRLLPPPPPPDLLPDDDDCGSCDSGAFRFL